jgi:predicted AAA+ superfamily ATPase
MMCAHQQGQLSNLSTLGQSLGVSHTSVRTYLDLLRDTYMLRILQPFHSNTGKRIAVECKASTVPKIGRGFYSAMHELEIDQAFVIAPVKEKYPLKEGVWVMPMNDAIKELV